MCDYQKTYYRVIMPEVRAAIAEFRLDMGDWGKERRRSYLLGQLNAIQSEIDGIHARYQELTESDSSYLNKFIATLRLEPLEKQLKKVKSELRYLKNSMDGRVLNNNGVTQDMIEQARSHPLEDLVDLTRGKALCPFHDDHHPSMSIKNNRYRCWACGENGDVIDFVMKRDGLAFHEAVRRLL